MKAQERGRDADLQRSAAVRCHVPNVILALASFDCVSLIFDQSRDRHPNVGPCRGTRRGYARHACGGPRRRGSFPLIPQSVTARTVAAVAQSAARPQRREQRRFQRIAWITGLPRCVAGRCSSCDGTVRAGVPYSVDASPSAAFAAVLTYRRCGSLSSSTGWRSSGCSSKIRFAGAGIMRSPCRRRARPIALPAAHAPLAMPMRSSARRCK